MYTRETTQAAMAGVVVGYVRVSTEEQAAEGVSLKAQEAALRAYCTMRGLQLVEVVSDPAVSAGKPLSAREGGRRVLDLVKRGKVGAVIAWKLDRLFRDAGDCLAVTGDWDKRGVALHLVDMGGQAIDTSTAVGKFFLTIMAGAAEMERNLIRERTASAMRFKRERGEFTGGPSVPFGYRLDADRVHLVEVQDEQRVIEAASQLRLEGLSLRRVAQRLSELGYRSRTGKAFECEQISRMLRRAA